MYDAVLFGDEPTNRQGDSRPIGVGLPKWRKNQVRDRNPAYETAANMDSTLNAEANDKNEDPRSNSVDDYDYMGWSPIQINL